jgi:hypothetical protein
MMSMDLRRILDSSITRDSMMRMTLIQMISSECSLVVVSLMMATKEGMSIEEALNAIDINNKKRDRLQ